MQVIQIPVARLGRATAVLITCAVFAAGLNLPTSSDVAIHPDSNQYQMRYAWGKNAKIYYRKCWQRSEETRH